jgi:Type I phosphodiesterase / nucleotide pyrophosphatase
MRDAHAAQRSAPSVPPDAVTDPPDPPDYGSGGLHDVLPAVVRALADGCRIGANLPRTGQPALSFEPVRRACVLLVDGLGWNLLCGHPEDAPFLTSLVAASGAAVGRPLVAGFPSTTATSLASFGTGLVPGGHGMTGLEIRLPESGRVLNCLSWASDVDPRAVQPLPTWFELADQAGIRVTRVGPRSFDGSGLTEAALRGGRYAPAETMGERIADALAGLAEAPSLVYVYHGDLDATGHRRGPGSCAWRFQLSQVDRMAEQLAGRLPADAAMWVLADHGMVHVPPAARIDLAERAELDEGVAALAGEPRARHVHARPGAAADVLATWSAQLGGDFHVRAGEELLERGWLGHPVSDTARRRVGDVVAVARTRVSLVDTRRMPAWVVGLVGQHGSVTADELLVPVLETR